MYLRRTRLQSLMYLAFSLSVCAGCASNPLKKIVAPIANIAPARAERSENAISEFERGRDQAQFTAALARWQEGDLTECRVALDEIVRRNPDHTQAQLLLSELLLTNKQPNLALEHVQSVLEREPENAAAIHTAGLAHEALGNTTVALDAYQRATELEPENEVFLLSYDVASDTPPRQLETSTVLLTNVAHDESGEIGNADSDDFANNVEPWRALLDEGALALQEGNDRAGRDAFDRAIRDFANDPQVPISIGVLSLRLNRPYLAREHLEPAVTRFPNAPRLHRTLGLTFYRLGQYEASQVSIRQALSLDNTDALSYLLLGSALSKMGDRTAAEEYLYEAHRLDPSLADFR